MKVGDKVKVTKRVLNTGVAWISEMDEFIGSEFVIIEDLSRGFLLKGNPYVYPTESLDLVEPEGFKAGDKVRVRDGYTGAYWWNTCMNDTIGKEFYISEIDHVDFHHHLDNGQFYYMDSLELVETNEQLDIHYKKEVEPIDLIEAFDLNFNLGNCVKYIARCNHKGSKQEDLRKALYYLNREFNGVD